MIRELKLAPSILSADFACLGKSLIALEGAGAHYLHIDVMDGHFVPNISLGIPVIESLRRVSRLVFDVHLMIENPERYIRPFADSGADIICFHVEAVANPFAAASMIRNAGRRPAIAIKPQTPAESLFDIVGGGFVDMVLIMSVEPGFGKQAFIPGALDKARIIKDFIDRNKLDCDIEMDGGLKLSNIEKAIDAGVNVLVSGSDIFGAPDVSRRAKEYIELFKKYELPITTQSL